MPFFGFVSAARIALTYGAGVAFIMMVRLSITQLRPDIVDEEHRPREARHLRPSYDFVVVGGGSAGAAMAARLAEVKDWNVLLLEAGPDEPLLSDLPLFMPIMQMSPVDWRFQTEPNERYCLAMKGGRCNWPRGKVLGGSSVLNAMLYVRGNRKDYDRWAALGNPGWSYEEVLPYFKKAEDVRIDALRDSPYHGHGGPLSVEEFSYHTPMAHAFLEAGREIGYQLTDVNGRWQTGFTLSHGTLRNGLRCSTAKAYLRGHPPNLHISLNTHVERVLIHHKTKSAYGVVFRKNGVLRTVRATREVILSAGAIQSPQLLMLSGVGPSAHLEELGIRVLQDLRGVGRNLQDHVALGGTAYTMTAPEDTLPAGPGFVLPRMLTLQSVFSFAVNNKGPLLSLPECEVMAFVNTKYSNDTDWPDVQLFLASYADNTDGGLFGKRDAGLLDEVYEQVFEPVLYKDSYSIIPLLLRPRSRGWIELQSKNPAEYPLIYPNYFDYEEDVNTLVEAAKIGMRLADTKPLRRMNAKLNKFPLPGCSRHKYPSDEYWACAVRHYPQTIYHPSGTCKMGPRRDPDAVVDARMRVYGVRKLRVVDASVMPFIVNGNTNAPTIMISEKVADMIKQDHGVRITDYNSKY